MTNRSFGILLVVLSLIAAALFIVSLAIGPAGIGFAISLKALVSNESGLIERIIRDIRLPRAILGVLVGATLGLCGAVMQGLLRNPLAEPGLIGVSASGSLGAVLAIYTGFSAAFALGLPLAALGGALLAVLAVRALAGPSANPLTLILAGVAISSLSAALTSLVLNLSPNPFAALEIMFWMMGSLADRSMTHVWLAAPFIVIGWALLFGLGKSLNALTLGQDAAVSMGIDLRRVQRRAVLGVATSVGAATAVAGSIGFVGLVVPHVLRPFTGALPSRLLPASALGGACVILAADILVRFIAPGRDVKLGVLTAIIGAPFFLWLVYRTRRDGI